MDGCSPIRVARSTVGLVSAIAIVGVMAWGGAIVAGGGRPDETGRPQQLEIRQPRVVILKSQRILYLFDRDKLVRSYDIALGSCAKGQKIKQGDGRTPEGVFRVCTKNEASPYHRFLGISYPDPAAARRGFRDGLISFGELQSILDAHAKGRRPNWTTALGGGIGIHGHGTATDWTAGCVALDDADAEELFRVLRFGDVVEILP